MDFPVAGSVMMDDVKRIRRELKYKGAVVDFYTDTMEFSNGHTAEWDYIEHKGAAAVLPVTDEGRILMVRQYRNALERYTLEIPAGSLDHAGEPMADCALRELEEETGYRAGKLEHLLTLNTTVAFCNERIGIYVAKELIPSHQNLDEDEFVDVRSCELDELLEMIYNYKITDGKTISALLAYKVRYLSSGGTG